MVTHNSKSDLPLDSIYILFQCLLRLYISATAIGNKAYLGFEKTNFVLLNKINEILDVFCTARLVL